MTAYQYEPLSPGSIRLLVLQPSASPDADLRGSLLCTTLSECNYDLIDNYTALSYVWGSNERPCLIYLDGKEFPITQSLSDALRDMRDATRARRIWADALCINQSDILERNNQVRLMGKIYEVASNTIIHFGRLTEDAAKVFSATKWKTNEVDYEMDHEGKAAAPAVAEVRAKQASAYALVVAASRDLLTRPWFNRIWVLQELVFSKDPWIQCGRQRVRWGSFCRLLLRKQTNMPDTHRALLDVLYDMNETRNSQARGVGKSLWDVLKMRRGLGATDPRDYIFAHLGIINDFRSARKYVNIDYGDSMQAVFSRMAAYAVSTQGIRWLMSQICDMHPEERPQGLPSWVPDWRYPASTITFRQQEPAHKGEYNVLDVDDVPLILAHTGCKVDVIKSVSAVFPLDRNVANALKATEEYLEVQQTILQLHSSSQEVKALKWLKRDSESSSKILSHHETLCKNHGHAWARFLKTLDQQSNDESSGDAAFAALFSRWISKQASTQRAGYYWTEGYVCYGIAHLLQRYLRYMIDEDLPGRRLAVTDSGDCALVPRQARNGDALIVLGDPTAPVPQEKPLLIVRQKEVRELETINATVMESIYNHRIETGQPFEGIFDLERWPAFLARGCVEHYWVIGQGYVDSVPGEPYDGSGKEMRVFALH